MIDPDFPNNNPALITMPPASKYALSIFGRQETKEGGLKGDVSVAAKAPGAVLPYTYQNK